MVFDLFINPVCSSHVAHFCAFADGVDDVGVSVDTVSGLVLAPDFPRSGDDAHRFDMANVASKELIAHTSPNPTGISLGTVATEELSTTASHDI